MSWVAALAAALMMTFSAPQTAHAQDPVPVQVDASPKGLIGLGFIGAELGLVIPAAAGLDDTWALILFPVIGAAGGAVAGHFLIDNKDKPRAAVAMLTLGLALIVPSLVLTLAVTAYDPDDDAPEQADTPEGEVEDPADLPADDAAAAEETAAMERARNAQRQAAVGAGLLRYGNQRLQLGVPGFGVQQTFTNQELARYGGEQRTEFHLSLFSGSF
jgi:hypothetical protein